MSSISYLKGNLFQALEALTSDQPQDERLELASVHIHKTPESFTDEVLSPESKERYQHLLDLKKDDPDYLNLKAHALRDFLFSAIQDVAEVR